MIVKSEARHLFGPFASVEVLEDRLSCDGTDLCFAVIGEYVVIETDPPGPADKYEWDGEQYVALPMLADEHAAAVLARWEQIKIERDRRLDTGGYLASGHWYNSDIRAKGEQSVLAGRADRIQAVAGDMDAQYVIGGESVLWKTMDNGYVPMTANLALAIREAAEAQTVKTYKAAATHQYFLNLSADPANYDFSTGWPDIYEVAA